VALLGGLGAGKTCLARGIARGLGVAEAVASPTYTIAREYEARSGGRAVPLFHIDAYRLEGDDDFEASGAGELLAGEGIAIIEWSERIPRSIPEGAIFVELEITGAQRRAARIRGPETFEQALAGILGAARGGGKAGSAGGSCGGGNAGSEGSPRGDSGKKAGSAGGYCGNGNASGGAGTQ